MVSCLGKLRFQHKKREKLNKKHSQHEAKVLMLLEVLSFNFCTQFSQPTFQITLSETSGVIRDTVRMGSLLI